MERLNELRNGFIHFKPGWWSVEAGYAVEALLGVYTILAFLIQGCPLITWYPDNLKPASLSFLAEVNESLDRLCLAHDVSR